MVPCCMILCGGKGTRLAPVTGNMPKALAKVGGQPFIYFLLEQIHQAEIRLAILCTGVGAQQIESELGDWYKDVKLVYSRESKPLGTAGALRNALGYANSDEILILNGDSFCQQDLSGFIRWHRDQKNEVSLLTTHSQDTFRFGKVNSSAGGRIVSFCPKGHESAPGTINAGIYLIPVSLLAQIPQDAFASLENDYFPSWAREKRMWAYLAKGPFIDIGTPESFAEAQNFFSPKVAQ